MIPTRRVGVGEGPSAGQADGETGSGSSSLADPTPERHDLFNSSPSDFSRLLRWTLSTPTDLEEVRAHVPVVGAGDHLPRGERVVVRADLDVPIEDGSVVDKARLSASAETLRTCIERGCRAVVLGHLGRSGGSLRVVATELGELVGSPIRFVDEWLDESSLRLTTAAQDAVAAASEGSIVMFDNVRRYEIEQRLWKADVDEWAGRCIRLQPTSGRRWAAYM